MRADLIELDAESLRAMLRAGGLEVSKARAGQILPVALALLRGCARLADLDLERPAGSGIARAPDEGS